MVGWSVVVTESGNQWSPPKIFRSTTNTQTIKPTMVLARLHAPIDGMVIKKTETKCRSVSEQVHFLLELICSGRERNDSVCIFQTSWSTSIKPSWGPGKVNLLGNAFSFFDSHRVAWYARPWTTLYNCSAHWWSFKMIRAQCRSLILIFH